jgi:hypothetical protein
MRPLNTTRQTTKGLSRNPGQPLLLQGRRPQGVRPAMDRYFLS